eukprot:6516996-Pyramimonas_sp.AAC.1
MAHRSPPVLLAPGLLQHGARLVPEVLTAVPARPLEAAGLLHEVRGADGLVLADEAAELAPDAANDLRANIDPDPLLGVGLEWAGDVAVPLLAVRRLKLYP